MDELTLPTEAPLAEEAILPEQAPDASAVGMTDTPTDPDTAPVTHTDKPTRIAPDFAALAAQDLRELQDEFAELSALSSLAELPNAARYGALRELGLTPAEAYRATASDRPDNRSHLRPSAPRAALAEGVGISHEELVRARDLFLGLSDHEIRKLYKRVTA